jgi:dihydropteroate synthase
MNNEFYVRKIAPESVENVIKDIGFDKSYINYALLKYKFDLVKIHNLSCPEANILKQLALSIGADAAVNREVITCNVAKSDVLLGCTHAQLRTLADKLKYQPFKLKKLAPLLIEQISDVLSPLTINNTIFDWSKKTYIMGILNTTPDSFSDGGKYLQTHAAVNHAVKMTETGADIIDIGGESTRPFAQEIKKEEELERVIPVIKKLREIDETIVISIDTRHAEVAKEAVINGANIVNDVSGFDYDTNMANTVAELQVPVVIMHSLSTPETMQINPTYPENIVDAIFKSLYKKIQTAINAGIKKENIIIDPGIGFGKTLEHNLEIIKRINEFTSLGCPILVGISRKSFISKILELPPEEREEANISLNSYLASNGVNIIRVHDIEKHNKALKILDKIIRT